MITAQHNPFTWWPDNKDEDNQALFRRMTGLAQFGKKTCINQLTGETFENDCPYVVGADSQKRWNELPELSTSAVNANPVWKDNKKRKLGEEFPEERVYIDLR